MANFYTDIPELKYHLNNPMMERICELKERGYRDKDEYDYAPQDYADALDSYDKVLEITGEITGEVIAANAEGVDVHPRLVCPPYQVRLDFVRQLLGALHGDDAKGRHTVFGTEKKLSRLFHMQAFPFFSGICMENTGALGQGFRPPFSS